jgi:hypothetical protein
VRGTGIALSCALAGVLLSGCAIGDDTRILPPVTEAVTVPSLDFDGSLEPAAAVLPLVPEDVATLTVTDFEQVRLQMGLQDLTSDDTRKDRDSFWARAEAERPLLTTGILRPIEPRLNQQFGLTQMDVDWEAHFFDAADREVGYVVAFRDGTDMDAVQDAVAAGFAALQGADVDSGRGLLTLGAATSGDESWAADADIRDKVGLPANSTYVSRACADAPVTGDLQDLAVYSIQFEGTLATARLGEHRSDLFTRMRLGAQVADFDAGYEGGVADPATGRIGYVMTDPAEAARMAIGRDLPFAACP